MTNSVTNGSDIEPTCPLGDLTKALSEAAGFYRRRETNDSNYREATGWDEPEIAACRRVLATACGDEGVDEVSVNGVFWRRATVPTHSWIKVAPSPDPYGGHRSHCHTSFDFAGHAVHVDFIKRSSSGPGCGVDDLQFFVDGEFVSRGGHAFTVPARIPRGEPAAMYWKEYLLICERNIDHWSTPHPSWFTLWNRVQRGDTQNITP
ncbi:MAG: hypothetical protein AB8B91_25280 [Rubripirellula sp.]